MENGIEGIISDNDEILAERTIALLKDRSKQKAMGEAARNLVEKKFSIEETYGKLSRYFQHLPNF